MHMSLPSDIPHQSYIGSLYLLEWSKFCDAIRPSTVISLPSMSGAIRAATRRGMWPTCTPDALITWHQKCLS